MTKTTPPNEPLQTNRRGFLKIFTAVSAALATGNVEQAANVLVSSASVIAPLRKKNRALELSWNFIDGLRMVTNHAEERDSFDVEGLLKDFVHHRHEYRGQSFFDVLQEELSTAHWRIASHDSGLQTILKSDKQRDALRDTFAYYKGLKQTLDGLLVDFKAQGMNDDMLSIVSDMMQGHMEMGRIPQEDFETWIKKYDAGELPWISNINIPNNLRVSPYGSADQYLKEVMRTLPDKLEKAVHKLGGIYQDPMDYFEQRQALRAIDKEIPEFRAQRTQVEEKAKEYTHKLQEQQKARQKEQKMNALERLMEPHVEQRFGITR